MKLYDIYSGKKLAVAEKIQRRRLQILVHSYIYYELNDNIIPDGKWDEWARELVQLQAKYPNMSKKIMYAEEFRGWDASTGAFLQFDSKVRRIARRLLSNDELKETTQAEIKVKRKQKKERRRLF